MCFPFSKEGKGGGVCRREGVVYLITCQECKKGGNKVEYWGETSRTGYKRGEEHLAGLKSQYEKNSLWKHSSLYYKGKLEKADFKMEII